MAGPGGLAAHDWAVIFDASSRVAEVVVTIGAFLYARRASIRAGKLGDFLGLSRASFFWRRKRPARASEDPVLDKLRDEADDALGRYLLAASRVDHYASKPTERKH